MSEGPLTLPLPQPSLLTKAVEIEIETPEQAKKREKREKRKNEFESYLRRMINRFNKDLRMDIHKVHLLCLLANGLFRNRTCCEPELRAAALSLVPAEFATVPAGCVDIPYVSNLLKWFVSAFEIDHSLPKDEAETLFTVLERRFNSHTARSEEEMVHLFLITLRSLPLVSRLVISFQPVPFKESSKVDKKTTRGRKSKDSSRQTLNSASNTKPKSASRKGAKENAVIKPEEDQDRWVKTSTADEEDEPLQISERIQAEGTNKRRNRREKNKNVKSLDGASDESRFEDEERPVAKKTDPPRPKNDRRRRVASKVSYKEEDIEEDDDSDSDFEVVNDSADSSNYSGEDNWGAPRGKGNRSRAKPSRGRQTAQGNSKGVTLKAPKCEKGPEDSEEENFENDSGKTNPAKRRSSQCNKTKDDSSNESMRLVGEGSPSSNGSDHWIEVYAEAEKKWVSVDCVRNTLNHPELCVKYASKPLSYIIGFDNESCLRDVTQRYDAAWMTATRKRRIDPGWWDKTLAAFKSSCTERQKEEDMELQTKLLDRPLPTTVAEYKSHPLYVLKRHLLKYEALYPSTASILGYCKTEAVYSRDCVHPLHSKDIWLKEARVVRDGELPCKMVKSQSNQARRARLADLENRDKGDLGLFGHWQTEPYQPPAAIGGKIPRNEFGNIYLFQPSMLPVGCKHLRVPNINRVARKLGIDCVRAVTGFEFHSGRSHPVTDGHIVCDEHVEILLAACEEEEAELERKEQEKREKRAVGNWKLLVKGLFIRERLKARFSSKDDPAVSSSREVGRGCSSDEGGPSDRPSDRPAPVTDVASSWPLNRQTAEEKGKEMKTKKSRRQMKGEEKHMFPFEKL
ncbi:DNA repair protein complementing XP-C cells isoform X2 [Heptranchias perlo]